MIFNSLGSNYDFSFVLKSLFTLDVDPNVLEKLLQEKYGGKANLVYKGREAIELALQTLSLPQGSFVAINGFTCYAVYEAVKKAGLNVEYLDIDRGELNFSADTLEEVIKKNKKMNKFSSSKIKAVIIQNTLGYPCQIKEISKICQDHNIALIEDLAHCVGTKYSNGEEAGTVGDMTILSFSQDKMMDGISGGALIIRDDHNLTEEFAKLSNKQQLKDRFYPLLTFLIRKTYPFLIGRILHRVLRIFNLLTGPMDGTDSDKIHQLPSWYWKLIKSQFEKLEENLNHRRKIASKYCQLINSKILSPKIIEQISLSTNLRFSIFVENRAKLIKFLAENQIFLSDIWYDAPIAPKKYLSQTDYAGQCPNAELAADEIVNLPTHINVKEKDAERIANLINLWLKSK